MFHDNWVGALRRKLDANKRNTEMFYETNVLSLSWTKLMTASTDSLTVSSQQILSLPGSPCHKSQRYTTYLGTLTACLFFHADEMQFKKRHTPEIRLELRLFCTFSRVWDESWWWQSIHKLSWWPYRCMYPHTHSTVVRFVAYTPDLMDRTSGS